MTTLTSALAPLANCWHHGWGGPWVPLFWIAVILFIVWLIRRGRWGRPRRYHHHQSAAEVLEHRFARGEIDDDEFRRRRSILGDQEHD
ncbi:MAG TPA: SHOCT domain-containing protein [Solirubrobacterales bacterium]|nr:SHOCT domain-containing protein [Solirubrobacterales bacterium]